MPLLWLKTHKKSAHIHEIYIVRENTNVQVVATDNLTLVIIRLAFVSCDSWNKTFKYLDINTNSCFRIFAFFFYLIPFFSCFLRFPICPEVDMWPSRNAITLSFPTSLRCHILRDPIWTQVELVSWCFQPSQPQRITSGLKTNFTLSPSYSLNKL